MPYQDPQRALNILTSGYTSFGGLAPPRAGTLDLMNIPGMNSQLGMVLGMALQAPLMQMTSNMGFVGLQFGGTQNLYDRFKAQEFYLESRKAIQESSKRDQQVYYEQLLGVAKLAGTNIGPEQQRAARTMASDIAQMGTIFGDMMPDMFDDMHGVRGSAAVMARRVHLGGRYAYDPVTGSLGISGDTAGLYSSQIYKNLYGPSADLTAMKGLGAGRVGSLYDELQRRGFLGGAVTSREQGLSRLAANSNMSGEDYARQIATDKGLGAMFDSDRTSVMDTVFNSNEFREKLTKSEADRIANKIKGLSGTVSAMRDIFGDMGKHDAPMQDLINGLQALTQGGLSTMSPGDLEQMVRRTQSLSKMGGVSMEAVMQLMSRGSGLSDQMGLDRRFGVQASQSSLAFATAYGSVTDGTGWRALDKDSAMMLDQNLRLNAARSDVVRQLNASIRLADESGVMKKGSEFEAMTEAIKKGKTSYEFGGQSRRTVKSFDEWMKLANDAGISSDVAYSIRAADVANQEQGARYNTENLGRMVQWDIDIAPRLMSPADNAFARLTNDPNKSAGLAYRAIEVLRNGGAATKDPKQRYDMLVNELRKTSKDLGLNLSDGQLRVAAMEAWTNMEDKIQKDDQLKAYGGFIGMADVHNRQTLNLGNANMGRANDQAQLASALSGLGRSSGLRRFADFLANTDKSADFTAKGFLAKVLGNAVSSEDLNKALLEFGTTYREYQGATGDGPEASARRAELLKKLSDLSTRANDAASKAGMQMDATPKEAASKFLSSVGRGGEEPSGPLLAMLATPESRARALSMASEFTKMKAFMSKEGLNPLHPGDQQKVKDFIGPESFKILEPLLKAMQSGKAEEALSDKQGKNEVQKVTLSEPIKIEGRVRMDGDWLDFEDTRSANHRVPIEPSRSNV